MSALQKLSELVTVPRQESEWPRFLCLSTASSLEDGCFMLRKRSDQAQYRPLPDQQKVLSSYAARVSKRDLYELLTYIDLEMKVIETLIALSGDPEPRWIALV
jgi:hypothetical protein